WNVNLRLGCGIDRVGAHVTDDTNDLARLLIVVADPPADRIRARRQASRKRLIDDGDLRRARCVASVEWPAQNKPYTHRVEVAGRDHSRLRVDRISDRPVERHNGASPPRAGGWQEFDRRDACHAALRGDTVQSL